MRRRARSRPYPAVKASELPWVTAAQMREIDRVVTVELGIDPTSMMENAGRHLAELAISRFDPRSAVILVGGGANGGGGLVAARHLANRGVRVRIVLDRAPQALVAASGAQLEVLRRLGVEVSDRPRGADLVVDAVIGYGLVGDPRGRTAEIIGWAAGRDTPVLALDVPSGLDATTGREGEPCVRAAATLTVAAPKTGLRGAAAAGELYLGDVSVPPVAFRSLGLAVGPIFARATILRVVGVRPRAPRPGRGEG